MREFTIFKRLSFGYLVILLLVIALGVYSTLKLGQLKNTIEYAVAMTTRDVINEDLILQTKTIKEGKLKPLREAKGEFEKSYISNLLSFTGGNVSKAAKLAGKYRADFYDLLKKHNLKAADFKISK